MLPDRPANPCAFEVCSLPAMVRLQSSNLCRRHANLRWQAEANAFVEILNLKTREEKVEYCADAIRAFLGRRPGKWWAEAILADKASGKPVSAVQEAIAREVVG